ncbi:MAG: deoxynucleoside monophosphate kinase [Terrestrivirus sp.]|uniref:Deoxynucleoside monophosphate kinase n=1 Tax=Terrestrivirus sp. TaxID=2487775 RepID=A0A3G4ZSP9_9VIRU|nr:MAG: deoxynucleoside monophosphate kinase [Terrestrivirus sp.]
MNKYKIIGITGRKFNGKDTIANYLRDAYGYRQIAFAGPLKEICGKLFGFTNEQLHGNLKETPDPTWFGLTPRQVLQFVGTNMFRDHMSELNDNFGNDFWLLCARKTMEKIFKEDETAKFVISDVRFPNEVEMIKQMGGVVLRVSRPSLNDNKNVDTHISELLIDELDVDCDVINNATKEELYNKIHNLFYEKMVICI